MTTADVATLQAGNTVRSGKQPQLGTGLLISVETSRARVFFPAFGEKVFNPMIAALQGAIATTAEEALFAILRDIQPWERENAHHRVYAVELRDEVRRDFDFESRNPQMRPDRACLYVGGTGLTPEERFKNHLAGYKSARLVSQFGLRLRPDLYGHFPPVHWKRLTLLEPAFAELLRSWGHGVWQN
jgi:hypothetical protein